MGGERMSYIVIYMVVMWMCTKVGGGFAWWASLCLVPETMNNLCLDVITQASTLWMASELGFCLHMIVPKCLCLLLNWSFSLWLPSLWNCLGSVHSAAHRNVASWTLGIWLSLQLSWQSLGGAKGTRWRTQGLPAHPSSLLEKNPSGGERQAASPGWGFTRSTSP